MFVVWCRYQVGRPRFEVSVSKEICKLQNLWDPKGQALSMNVSECSQNRMIFKVSRAFIVAFVTGRWWWSELTTAGQWSVVASKVRIPVLISDWSAGASACSLLAEGGALQITPGHTWHMCWYWFTGLNIETSIKHRQIKSSLQKHKNINPNIARICLCSIVNSKPLLSQDRITLIDPKFPLWWWGYVDSSRGWPQQPSLQWPVPCAQSDAETESWRQPSSSTSSSTSSSYLWRCVSLRRLTGTSEVTNISTVTDLNCPWHQKTAIINRYWLLQPPLVLNPYSSK